MPRKKLPSRKAKAALDNLRLESARRLAVVARREHHAREAALALRKNTPDWVDMDVRLKQLALEAEMDAMETAIDARSPKTPILNFDLMPGFQPPTPPSASDKEKNWACPGYGDDRRPEDDWRNYE